MKLEELVKNEGVINGKIIATIKDGVILDIKMEKEIYKRIKKERI